jgi:hypothetical protein
LGFSQVLDNGPQASQIRLGGCGLRLSIHRGEIARALLSRSRVERLPQVFMDGEGRNHDLK